MSEVLASKMKDMTLRQLLTNLDNDLKEDGDTGVHLGMTLEDYFKNLFSEEVSIDNEEVKTLLASPRTKIECSQLKDGVYRKFVIKAIENDEVLGEIKFQNGELVNGINGVFLTDLLEISIQHLKDFQDSPFRCRENAIALTNIEDAQLWLEKRRKERSIRGVEGTHTV
jgi:hypothetical protein